MLVPFALLKKRKDVILTSQFTADLRQVGTDWRQRSAGAGSFIRILYPPTPPYSRPELFERA